MLLGRVLLPSGFAIATLPLLFVLRRRVEWLALALHLQLEFFTLAASSSLLGSRPDSLPLHQIACTRALPLAWVLCPCAAAARGMPLCFAVA